MNEPLEETLGRELAEIIKTQFAPCAAALDALRVRLGELENRPPIELAPDDVAEQIGKALAIIAQPVSLPASGPPAAPQTAPSVVNIAMPEPRKTAKQIKVRRDAENNLVADVIERELD